MPAIIPRLVVLLAFSTALLAAERMVTEVISIGYRDAREVATMLKPMVPPPGTVTSLSDKLIVKTTPANLREIKQLLQTIDKAPVNLMVSVKHVLDEEVRRDLAEVFAEAKSGDSEISAGSAPRDRRCLSASAAAGESSARVRVLGQERAAKSEAAQQIRVLEGKTAFIATGESKPFQQRSAVAQGGRVIVQESVEYVAADSGFFVRPRISGDRVILEIIPTHNRFDGARIESRETRTTLSGRLGHWMEISAASQSGSRIRNGIGRSEERRQSASYTVYL
ncbi:MAG TPA: secretin N-terminal domain-containing protein, partial [Gammaproteobacteria bacterium]|nr:secretin N-terminal domain-containing protein [Gammaproteobacteria bacterium]